MTGRMTAGRFVELSCRRVDLNWCGDDLHRELIDALAVERECADQLDNAITAYMLGDVDGGEVARVQQQARFARCAQ